MESDEDTTAAMMEEDSFDDEDMYDGGGGGDDDSERDNVISYGELMGHASGDFDDLSSSHLSCSHMSQNCTILKEEDISRYQNESITQISTVLSISRVAASILLRQYNWSVSKVNDEWFADEDKVRKTVGLLKNCTPIPNDQELTCGICFENHPRDGMSAAACGHPFCVMCWKGYICTSINDGPGCLMLRCPNPSCGAAVGHDMVNELAPEYAKEKYNRYFLRSFVEDNRKTKWCPAPGCDYAVYFTDGGGNYDVTCHCTYSFCWNALVYPLLCLEEAHRPVDCGTVSKWILKNSNESENINWILANSKPCPKCKRPIEKIQGCMHITCTSPCRFEFCWLCLGAWSEHGERTGGFYECNRYEEAMLGGVYYEAEKRREMAKNSLERYTHYYERWATNQSLKMLSHNQGQPESHLKFVVEAWQQIVECRRVLKWAYAYGFYLDELEHAKEDFFEYLKGEAESGLERLHECAENELQGCLESEGPSQEFNEFRTKLAGLTRETKVYFENLVRAMENGLSDADSHAASGWAGGEASASRVRSSSEASTSRASSSRNTDNSGHWSCQYCTYANVRSSTVCEICQHYR